MTHDQKTRLARIKERKRAVLEARGRARQVVVARVRPTMTRIVVDLPDSRCS